MILSPVQQDDYTRLFHSLMEFFVHWLHRRGLLDSVVPRSLRDQPSDVVGSVLGALFDGAGHIQAIREFMGVFEGDLSERDCGILLSWTHVVRDEYHAVRKGPDVFLIDDDGHVFSVCGISHEIDDRLVDVPMRVSTYLAPFGNVITYLDVIKRLSDRLPKDEEARLLAQVDKAARNGLIVRTGKQFVEVRKEKYGDRGDSVLTGEAIRRILSLAGSWHVGSLAGLPWEERQAQAERLRREKADHEHVIERLDASCLPGEPVRQMREICDRTKFDTLKGFAEEHGVFDAHTKEELVEANAEIYGSKLPDAIDNARKMGISFLMNFRDLHEHGGELRFEKDEVHALKDLPTPLFPYTALFSTQTHYVEVLCDELSACCAGINWEDEVAHAQLLEDALLFLETAIDWRGIVACGEAIDEVEARYPAVDPDELMDAMRIRFEGYLISVGPASFDGKDYLVAAELFDEHGFDSAMARSLLSHHKGRNAVWPTAEQASQGALRKAWGAYDAARVLAAYLDAHVLDLSSDESYADVAMLTVVSAMQLQASATGFLAQSVGLLAIDDTMRPELTVLLQDLYNALPNRFLNGQTPRYRWDKSTAGRKPKKKRPTKRRRR